MEAINTIMTRKSIRKYTSEKIPRDKIKILLKAAMQAPSARNQQPWHFIVVEDPVVLTKISDFSPNTKMCTHAPLGILIIGDLSLDVATGFWPQDCAAATQNMLLAAHAERLGAVWTGIYPREERQKFFQKLFSLPKELIPFSFVVIGYPDESPIIKERYLEQRVHYDTW